MTENGGQNCYMQPLCGDTLYLWTRPDPLLYNAGYRADVHTDLFMYRPLSINFVDVICQESVGLMGVAEGETGDVSRFLNRILGLKVHQQNLVRGA